MNIQLSHTHSKISQCKLLLCESQWEHRRSWWTLSLSILDPIDLSCISDLDLDIFCLLGWQLGPDWSIFEVWTWVCFVTQTSTPHPATAVDFNCISRVLVFNRGLNITPIIKESVSKPTGLYISKILNTFALLALLEWSRHSNFNDRSFDKKRESVIFGSSTFKG